MIVIPARQLQAEDVTHEFLIAIAETMIAVHEPQLAGLVVALRDRGAEEICKLRRENSRQIDSATSSDAYAGALSVMHLDWREPLAGERCEGSRRILNRHPRPIR